MATDDPYGQPIVTAKAWAIADATNGKILWGHKQDVELDIARYDEDHDGLSGDEVL